MRTLLRLKVKGEREGRRCEGSLAAAPGPHEGTATTVADAATNKTASRGNRVPLFTHACSRVSYTKGAGALTSIAPS